MLAWWLQTGNGTAEQEGETQSGSDGETEAELPATDGGDATGETGALEDQALVQTGTDAVDEAGEPQITPDAAQSLGTVAESIRESTVGQLVDDADMPTLFGITALEWGLGLGTLIVVLAVRQILLLLLNRYMQPIVERTETKYDDRILKALKRAISWLVVIVAFFLAFTFIPLPGDWQANVMRVISTFMMIAVGFLVYRIIEIFLHFITHDEDGDKKSVLDQQFFPLLRDIAKFVILVLVIVAVVQGWGYSATGILAGVGIGGLAMAFAAQDTVANIFGSFVIYSDRPYKVGDWIKIGEVEGTVEEVGIRSTRIRTFDKTLVLVPNKVVANENIQNFSAMPIRRIKLYVGVSYETSVEQMRDVVGDIRRLLAENPDIDQDYWVVNFTEMNSSSLDILIYCFTNSTVWQEYLDTRQNLLISIIEICEARGVEIAFPTQTIYYKNADLPAELAREAGGGLPGKLEQPPHIAARERARPEQPGENRKAEFDTAEGENGGS